MNKETQVLIDYINKSGYYLEKVDKLKQKFNNIKDFTNQFGYVIMEIVGKEPTFLHLNRSNIELQELSVIYFK